ncbi:hypothetical protein [Gottfriedia sp. OAE603]|uniref:hypothetical protein n=1 Tax=Gottfriedia sp. OAE603 TaxID=2663872 RepID=UPI00347EC888
MVKYWELAKSQMKVDSAYTAWYWAETCSAILRLLITYYFWLAVYENNESIKGIGFQSMLTYIVVAMIIEQYVSGCWRWSGKTNKRWKYRSGAIKTISYVK